MQVNYWKIKSNKQFVYERTKSQQNHLSNMMNIKSKVDSHNTLKRRNYSTASLNAYKQKFIQKDNDSMFKRIENIHRGKSKGSQRENSLRSMSHKLKSYSSANKTIKSQQIQKQNSRLLNRIVTASPVFKRRDWIKRNFQTSKYKQNLNRGKSQSPDFSQQACKVIVKREHKFKKINIVQNKFFRIKNEVKKQFR